MKAEKFRIRFKPSKRRWKFITEKEFQIKTNWKLTEEFVSEWLSITPEGQLTVKATEQKGYAWDGCSPKYGFLDIIIGTPDGGDILKKLSSPILTTPHWYTMLFANI